MIVCNCNALNDRKIDDAIEAGAKCWREVQAHHDCTPQCGACECEITERLDERRLAAPFSDHRSIPPGTALSPAE